MDLINLNSFLKLGWFLGFKNKKLKFNYSGIDKNKYKGMKQDELINLGVTKFRNAISSIFESNKSHVVPISGGLDSRAILAGLLEHTSADKIYTYTFGTPGTLDYEIGNKIAKIFGTKHTKFPLTEYNYNIDEMLDISKKVDFQTILFHHPPIRELENRYKDKFIWSGFMGDPSAGSHYKNYRFNNLNELKAKFIEENRYVRSINLNNIQDIELYKYIDEPFFENKNISEYEQIDFANRQLKYIAPHVLLKGFNYKLPFLEKEWFDFILSVDNKYRKDTYLYKKILIEAFPKAFKYESKSNYNLPLTASKFRIFSKRAMNKIKRSIGLKRDIQDNINYIDFNRGIRNRDDLKNLVYKNIMDLKERRLVDWIDIEKIWNRHINNEANHADALIVLTSLEIHLKNGVRRF